MIILSILLTGLFAGIGFANVLGYMPAFKKMPQASALVFWQTADHYFRARMPLFGISLQVVLLVTAVIFFIHGENIRGLLVTGALLLSVAELIIITKKNLPLNIRVQQAGNKLPNDFEVMRLKAIRIFNLRAYINIAAFILVVMASELK